MKEAELVRRMLAYINERGDSWAFKVHTDAYSHAGVPDILGCCRGQMFAIEVKLPGNEPTRIQSVMMARIKQAGARVDWFSDYRDFVAVFESWFEVAK